MGDPGSTLKLCDPQYNLKVHTKILQSQEPMWNQRTHTEIGIPWSIPKTQNSHWNPAILTGFLDPLYNISQSSD